MRSLVKLTFSCALLLGMFSLPSQAESLSPAMIQQLKSLPPAEQQALAKQYGIQLPATAASKPADLASLQGELPQVEVASQKVDVKELKASRSETPLARFGLSLFDTTVSTFAPTDNAQVPPEYRVGVGDELVVQLFGKDNNLLSLQVNRDGIVNFPKLGPISVAGLSFEDAQRIILKRVEQQLIGVEAMVSIGRLRAMNVFMAGEVKVPGAYSVSALTTITQALFQAGGVTDIGSLRNVQVKRQGRVVAQFDIYDLLLKGDLTNDIRLQSGDVVFVPPYDALVSVTGEVKRPSIYEVVKGENLEDLILMSGGYKSTAFAGELVVIKKRAPGELPVALNIRAGDDKKLAMEMSNGDVVRVLPLGDNIQNLVTLEGAIARPGVYGWKDGLRISDLISDISRDLSPEADLSYSLIVREKNQRLDIELVQFSIVDAVTQPGSQLDPVLNRRDKVLVFSWPNITQVNDDLAGQNLEAGKDSRQTLLPAVISKLKSQARAGAPAQLASIAGAVKVPGEYPITASNTVHDLIEAAGGADDSAFNGVYEIRRVTVAPDGNSQVDLIDISGDQINDFTLTSRDVVTVKQKLDWNPTQKVTISGEVKYPGEYYLVRGERISDVIKRAGGFAENAFPKGAVFKRKSIAKLETEQARAMLNELQRTIAASYLTKEQQNSLDAQSLDAITSQLGEYQGVGRLVVNLPLALMGDEASDLLLEDGDAIHIPASTNTITVLGEVRRQGSHTFEAGLSLDDYIDLAAGTTKRADADNIYVVRASGEVARLQTLSWTQFTPAKLGLEPGDSIVVPINTEYKDTLPFWRDITQIIYQGTVTIAAVARL